MKMEQPYSGFFHFLRHTYIGTCYFRYHWCLKKEVWVCVLSKARYLACRYVVPKQGAQYMIYIISEYSCTHCKPKPCISSQGTPCESIPMGKNLFSLQGTPVLIAGTLYSLQGIPCENYYTGKSLQSLQGMGLQCAQN